MLAFALSLRNDFCAQVQQRETSVSDHPIQSGQRDFIPISRNNSSTVEHRGAHTAKAAQAAATAL